MELILEKQKQKTINGDLVETFEIPTFIKWAGGKGRLLKQYSKLFPKKINNYFEPFLGSGSVFFYVKKNKNPINSYLSDLNQDLVNTFIQIRDNPEKIIQILNDYKKKDLTLDYFNKQRNLFNHIEVGIEKAALFIYLNKTCFNGLYRVNSQGKFNVPFGKYKNPSIFSEDKLYEGSRLLKKSELHSSRFDKIVKKAQKGDFIYFDPPYFPVSKTSSFTSYHISAFLEKEQTELSKLFKELDDKGCFVMLSNSDTELIRNLYKDYNMFTVRARRAINCIASKRGLINEIVVTNY